MSIIREKREERKWTRKQLAEKLDIHEQVIVRWESFNQVPTIFDVKKIYRVLKIPLQDLIDNYNKEGK